MTSAEARAARISLGFSEDALAAEINTTPAVVAAWESGAMTVPRHVSVELTWRIAQMARAAALDASGLPECAWVHAFGAEPVPDKAKAQGEHWKRLLEHTNACDVCKARHTFIADRFPPMPPAPRYGLAAILAPIVEQIQRLPVWAQPVAAGASLFFAYSLFRLVVLLPVLVRSPIQGMLTALQGILLSTSIGALVGALYGQYQRFRKRSLRTTA